MPKRELPLSRWIPYIIFAFVVLLAIALILPAIQQARESARRSTDKNNLKQLGLALHNYHDTFETLPPGGIFSEDGTAYHGWFTFLMPYLCASPMYNMIDFDHSWTDPVNEHVHKQNYCSSELNPKIDLTFTTEGYGLLHYSAHDRLFHRNSSIALDDIDGLSQTWAFSNVFEDWLPWGSPYSWQKLELPLPGSFEPHGWRGGGVHLLFADGQVRMVAPDLDPTILESYRARAPEVPTKLTEKPKLEYEYTELGPPIEWGSIDPDEDDSPLWKMIRDPEDRVEHLTVGILTNASDRPVIADDLRKILKQKADVKILRAEIGLDDQVAEILVQTTRLECLDLKLIELSDEGIEQLQKLGSLRILKGAATPEMADKLRAALPNCELRLHEPGTYY